MTRHNGARSTTVRFFQLGGIVFALALVATACGRSFSTDVNAYIPSEVDGKQVERDAEVLKPLIDQFKQTGSEFATGTIGGAGDLGAIQNGDQASIAEFLPDPIMIAAKSTGGQGDNSLAQLTESGIESTTETIYGVEVTLFGLGDQQQGSFAVAEPVPGIELVAMSITGNADTTKAAITAMLSAGS